jgi:hypothetical protein
MHTSAIHLCGGGKIRDYLYRSCCDRISLRQEAQQAKASKCKQKQARSHESLFTVSGPTRPRAVDRGGLFSRQDRSRRAFVVDAVVVGKGGGGSHELLHFVFLGNLQHTAPETPTESPKAPQEERRPRQRRTEHDGGGRLLGDGRTASLD